MKFKEVIDKIQKLEDMSVERQKKIAKWKEIVDRVIERDEVE